jgi:hypothetical protein
VAVSQREERLFAVAQPSATVKTCQKARRKPTPFLGHRTVCEETYRRDRLAAHPSGIIIATIAHTPRYRSTWWNSAALTAQALAATITSARGRVLKHIYSASMNDMGNSDNHIGPRKGTETRCKAVARLVRRGDNHIGPRKGTETVCDEALDALCAPRQSHRPEEGY